MKNDCLIKLYIDGVQLPVDVVEPMYQDDPFPGEHHFRIVVHGSDLDTVFKQLDTAPRRGLDRSTNEDYFFDLMNIISKNSDQESSVCYFLNKIIEVSHVGDEVILSGVCSEVIE